MRVEKMYLETAEHKADAIYPTNPHVFTETVFIIYGFALRVVRSFFSTSRTLYPRKGRSNGLCFKFEMLTVWNDLSKNGIEVYM